MEKQRADRMIEQYFRKIYGFAARKAFSGDEADELSAEMAKEVYLSLLSAEEIANPEGYIRRICSNVYAKHVASRKKQGLSLDGMEIPYGEEYEPEEAQEELYRLRREIAFLTASRRKIVYAFYYEGKSISRISAETRLPAGTVKWHLNKARNDLKEGFEMERKIGKLGIAPIEHFEVGHRGIPEKDGGPEKYLNDAINVNIVYSVYHTPRTREGIAEELGMNPVFISPKIDFLEENGFLVRTKGGKYTTYVMFTPEKVSLELADRILEAKLRIVKELVRKYVPQVRKAIENFTDVYIPGGNRELFEAAVVFYAVANKCAMPIKRDIGRYSIKTPGGGDYTVLVQIPTEPEDPDYVLQAHLPRTDYGFCGDMHRASEKYPAVMSWSMDSRFCSRQGGWANNKTEDYEYLYEYMSGKLTDGPENREKTDRLRNKAFISEDGKVNVMVVKADMRDFFSRIPELDQSIKDEFAKFAMDTAMQSARAFPKQMQDYQIYRFFHDFIAAAEAMLVLDELYDTGVFKPLSETEKITSQLLVFSDRLPE